MTFTAEIIDAQRALEYGLVSRVVAHDQLMSAARELAERIAVHPPYAMRMTKKLIREGIHGRLDSVLELSAVFQAVAHKTDEHREAVSAFLEKRPPNFNK
jgi:enoyl-CoA hydratase/carnithine racemase